MLFETAILPPLISGSSLDTPINHGNGFMAFSSPIIDTFEYEKSW